LSDILSLKGELPMPLQLEQETHSEQVDVERRASERYRCCRECTVRPEQAAGIGSWPGIVYNISAGGIGVALACPIQAGTRLVIDGWGPTAGRKLRVRVVRSVPVAYVFFHGCEFVETVPDEEVRRWVV
jgi:hypothetical protein